MLKIANSQQIICVLAVLSLVWASLLGIVLPCLIHAQNIGAEPALNKAAQEQSEGAIPDLVKPGLSMVMAVVSYTRGYVVRWAVAAGLPIDFAHDPINRSRTGGGK
jgi:hypothetical protein